LAKAQLSFAAYVPEGVTVMMAPKGEFELSVVKKDDGAE